MDIAKVSMTMSASQTQSAYAVAMLSKSLDMVENTGSQIVQMIDSAAMERSVNPGIGANFDMYI